MTCISKTEAARFIEVVNGTIIGDIPPPMVSVRIFDSADGHLCARKDGFPDDAAGRQWAIEWLADMRKTWAGYYPQGIDVQFHTY